MKRCSMPHYFLALVVPLFFYQETLFGGEPYPHTEQLFECISQTIEAYHAGQGPRTAARILERHLYEQGVTDWGNMSLILKRCPSKCTIAQLRELHCTAAGSCWHHVQDCKITLCSPIYFDDPAYSQKNIDWARSQSPMDKTLRGRYLGRGYCTTALEESIHLWQNNVPMDVALSKTPNYARYLRETGVAFHNEAYAGAFLDEAGMGFSRFQQRFYAEREAYYDWLKKNGLQKARACPYTERQPESKLPPPRDNNAKYYWRAQLKGLAKSSGKAGAIGGIIGGGVSLFNGGSYQDATAEAGKAGFVGIVCSPLGMMGGGAVGQLFYPTELSNEMDEYGVRDDDSIEEMIRRRSPRPKVCIDGLWVAIY
jgi:hypothetical protein